MSNASLKDQLRAVADQLSVTVEKNTQSAVSPKRKPNPGKPSGIKQPKVAKPKPAWLQYAQYGVELLKLHYPKCFFEAHRAKPLKKGIKQDLVKQLTTLSDILADDKACMLKSLSYYVNTLTYLKQVVEGAARIDLDGHPAGLISPEEAKYSQERLLAKQAARNKPANQQRVAATAVKETTELA